MRLQTTGFALAALTACLGAGGACAPRDVRPDEMSAEKHRHEAAKEEAAARAHVAEDIATTHSAAPVPILITDPGPDRDAPEATALGLHDPSRRHVDAAVRHHTHAGAHRDAAAALDSFEVAECASFLPEERAVCPLLGSIRSITDVAGGIRIHFEAGVSVEALVARMRCHLRFARARGYDDATACLLYMEGVRVTARPGGRAMDVTAERKATTKELRTRARALLADESAVHEPH